MPRRKTSSAKAEAARIVFAFLGLGLIWLAWRTGLTLWFTTALLSPLAPR